MVIGYAKLGRVGGGGAEVNKMHYGPCGNGQLRRDKRAIAQRRGRRLLLRVLASVACT